MSSSESMFVVGGVASEARAVAGPVEGGREGEALSLVLARLCSLVALVFVVFDEVVFVLAVTGFLLAGFLAADLVVLDNDDRASAS